ncbi:12-oxophytodienoate reductase [Sphingomonas paeninsulae]|uniref:12-oxophytodienoate reductase n=1 Tax=Sphingomonas paeninsulae TaxID=2319844 RepID=A0A494TC67_SPHPE|nr:NADH:flavin oxidoreductase [Sphingomonas paeninsulae]AYJ87027.1 12-oxophytodienoate reductase [Sphingomonas paeninsulae]
MNTNIPAESRTRDILFAPFATRSLTLPNRIVMSPMGRSYAPNGRPHGDYASYFSRRVKGGVGLAITGAAAVAHDLADYDGTGPHFFGDDALNGWVDVLTAVHAAGGKLMPQLWHTGMERRTAHFGPEQLGDARAIGPSGLSIEDLDAGRAPSGRVMDADDIASVINAFATAARSAQERGFDGVEVHAGHGFLLDQFLWSRTNRRQDGYGGSAEGRARFPAEVVAACRRAVGPDFPILVRMSQFKIGAYEDEIAATPDELGRLLAPIADAGADILHCSQREAWAPAFAGSPLNLAGWAKRLTGLPSIAVGSIGLGGLFTEEEAATPGAGLPPVSLARLDDVCAMMARGEFDLLAIGRSLLADADWPRKIRDGRDAELNAIDLVALTTLS